MGILLAGVGGIFGSITRYKLGIMISKRNSTGFPVHTFIINITGAVLLGILSRFHNNNMYFLLGDGFLGAYTTFSTFMYEGVKLIGDNKYLNSAFYIISSIIMGMVGFYFGYAV